VTFFGCIEDIKNGTLNVHKYNSVAMVVRPATVLIVTNQLDIDRSLLSRDRWVILTIGDKPTDTFPRGNSEMSPVQATR
jgi:hypothetical protein